MKNIALILIATLFSFLSFAQPGPGREKIEAAKIGFLTQRLDLSSDQAKVFWPVYNEYEEKKHANRESMGDLHRDLREMDDAGDKEYEKVLDKFIRLREEELAIEKEYTVKFQEVLSPLQVLKLFKAERDFAVMLLKKLEGPPPGRR